MRIDLSTDIARLLAEERRGRLAAERLLEQKQAELRAAYRKLDAHARQLSAKVTKTSADLQEIRNENARVLVQLGEATEKIEAVEGQLWQALTAIRDGFAMFDSAHRMELANPAYLRVFDGIEDVGPGAAIEDILAIIAQEGLVDLEGERPVAWRDRMAARWLLDPIPPETLRLWNGRFIKLNERHRPQGGVVTLAVDITDLMRMWSAVDELPDGFVLYDEEDRLVMCNRRYREIYAASDVVMQPGVKFEEILRYGLANGQYAHAAGREDAWLEERLSLHREAVMEFEQPLEDGTWLRVFERATREGGRVGLRVDISQLKRDQKRLEEAILKSEAANRAKSAFLANMSHEIRTPMNGVVGMADLMMDGPLTEEQRAYVETIRASGEALLVIINDILDYSKIEADRIDLRPEPFDLERAIHDVLMLVQPLAREKGLSLLVDYDMFLPTRFVADAGRVRQVLTNLVGNAVKFTAEGSVTVRVVGLPSEDGGTAVNLTVEDTGIGIPRDRLDDIFGEFTQVDENRNRAFEGTGLGLSITQRLVTLMGGEVWADSELGQGACFGVRVVLPVAQPPEILTADVPVNIRRVVASVDGPSRSILGKQLDALGLETRFVEMPDDMLQAVDDATDLAIVRVDAIERDVPGFIAGLRAKRPDLPVILVVDQTATAAPPAGVHAVLTKPLSRRALFAAIESLGGNTDHRPADTDAGNAGLPVFRTRAGGDPPALAAPAAPRSAARFRLAPPAGGGVPDETEAPAPPAGHDGQAEPGRADVAGTEKGYTANPPASRLDVLVAEDNRTNQLVFRKMAAAFDVDLRFANNGQEAVDAYREKRPDLVFMDISMPVMDGTAATAAIRAIEAGGPRVPIVAVTAHAMTGDRETILSAGLDDYLTKPLRKAELAEKIAAWGRGGTPG